MTKRPNEPFELMSEAEILSREKKNKQWTQQATLQPSDNRRLTTDRTLMEKCEEAAKPFSIDDIANEEILKKLASAEAAKSPQARGLALPNFQKLFADPDALSPFEMIKRTEQATRENADIVFKYLTPDLSDNMFSQHNKRMGYQLDIDRLRSLHSQFIKTHDVLTYELNGEVVNVNVPFKTNPHNRIDLTFITGGSTRNKIDFYYGARGYIPHPDEFKFLQKPNLFFRETCSIEINPGGYGIKLVTRPRDWGKAVESYCKKYLELHSNVSFYKDISIIGALND